MGKPRKFDIQKVKWEQIGPNTTAIFQAPENCTVQYWELPAGSSSKDFPHKHDFEQISVVLTGNCIFGADGEEFECGPGTMMYFPANCLHYGITVGQQTATCIDIFAPKRNDRAESKPLE